MVEQHHERIEKLEKEVRLTQDSVLLIHKDLEQMSRSMTKMADSMAIMVDIQSNMKVFEERVDLRSRENKDAHTAIHVQLDAHSAKLSKIDEKCDKGDQAYGILVFIAKTLGGFTLTFLAGLVIWAIAQSGGLK